MKRQHDAKHTGDKFDVGVGHEGAVTGVDMPYVLDVRRGVCNHIKRLKGVAGFEP